MHARSIVFVCKGNICRSPLAAALATKVAGELNLHEVRCTSAGLTPSRDEACPVEAEEVARRHGLRLEGHRPSGLDVDLASNADLIIVMEARQLTVLRKRWPSWRSKILLLPMLDRSDAVGAFERHNIVDPYGKPAEAFERCLRQIERSVRALLAEIAESSPVSGR